MAIKALNLLNEIFCFKRFMVLEIDPARYRYKLQEDRYLKANKELFLKYGHGHVIKNPWFAYLKAYTDETRAEYLNEKRTKYKIYFKIIFK